MLKGIYTFFKKKGPNTSGFTISKFILTLGWKSDAGEPEATSD